MHFSYKMTAFVWGFSELQRYIPGTIWPILKRSSQYEQLGSERKAILTSILHEAEFMGVACLLLSFLSLNFLIFALLPQYLDIVIPAILISTSVISLTFLLFHKQLLPHKTFLTKHFFPDMSITKLIKLLLLMTGAFFLFGLSTYFAVDAITILYFPHVVSLSAFFVLSFLVGYLSFLAPMGLGVREAVVTYGLSKYVTLEAAALGAIFSRIIQIIGELLFLAIVAVWVKFLANKTKKIEVFVIEHKYQLFLALFVLLYILYFTIASFLRYDSFFTGRFDLGNMDQTVWNTIHGRIFQLTNPDGTNIMSRLAFHADFILVLLSPLYLIWQDPRMLLLTQTVALAVGGIFVYLIGTNILQKRNLAFAFALSYLIYPAINHANLFDFHPVTLAVPFLLAGWYMGLKQKYYIAGLFFLLAGTTKEEVWIMTGLLGIYFLFWKKQKIFGSLLTLFSFGMFYYLFWHAIPAARGAEHFALAYYSDFGTSPTIILKNIVFSPIKTLAIVFGKAQVIYLLELFAPLFFLPLLAVPLLIFVAPEMGIDLLSQNAQLHSIHYHYAAIFAPFLFITAMYGLRIVQSRWKRLEQFAMYIILIPAILCAYVYGPLPGALSMNHDMFTNELSYAPLIDSFLLSIPKRYSVAATNNVGSHLAHRQKIFTIPTGLKEADIVVFLLNDQYAQPSLVAQKEMAKELDNDPSYSKLFAYQDFVVYKKKNIPTYYRRPTTNILPLFKGN